MKIKFLLGFVILFISLYGFKYMRENNIVMPISSEGLLQIAEQVKGIVEKEYSQETGVVMEESSETQEEGGGGDEVLKEPDSAIPSELEAVEVVARRVPASAEKQVEKKGEENYLRSYGIKLNEDASPSVSYMKKCAVCHGNRGTGFNNGRELLGGGLVHMKESQIFTRLLDFQEGNLESVYMKEVLMGMDKAKLKAFSLEIGSFKR